VGAGVSQEEYSRAIQIVTKNARSGSDAQPSRIWLDALEQVERPTPAFVPVRSGHKYEIRAVSIHTDLGAFQSTTMRN
jgi:hypothetical protein